MAICTICGMDIPDGTEQEHQSTRLCQRLSSDEPGVWKDHFMGNQIGQVDAHENPYSYNRRDDDDEEED